MRFCTSIRIPGIEETACCGCERGTTTHETNNSSNNNNSSSRRLVCLAGLTWILCFLSKWYQWIILYIIHLESILNISDLSIIKLQNYRSHCIVQYSGKCYLYGKTTALTGGRYGEVVVELLTETSCSVIEN